MTDIVDAALKQIPLVKPCLFVDDLSNEATGNDEQTVAQLGSFADHAIDIIHADGMEVSQTKSVISASHPTLATGVGARPNTPNGRAVSQAPASHRLPSAPVF